MQRQWREDEYACKSTYVEPEDMSAIRRVHEAQQGQSEDVEQFADRIRTLYIEAFGGDLETCEHSHGLIIHYSRGLLDPFVRRKVQQHVQKTFSATVKEALFQQLFQKTRALRRDGVQRSWSQRLLLGAISLLYYNDD